MRKKDVRNMARGSIFLKKGQSLFEVVVALALVAMILIAVVTLATTSVRNSDFSRDNSVVTKYAQEAVEWVRQQRDESWTNVASRANGSAIDLGDLSWSSPDEIIDGTNYSRVVTLSFNDSPTNSSIKAIVTVSWTDGAGVHSVTSRTILTDWRNL